VALRNFYLATLAPSRFERDQNQANDLAAVRLAEHCTFRTLVAAPLLRDTVLISGSYFGGSPCPRYWKIYCGVPPLRHG
jgi:hypothetical protein